MSLKLVPRLPGEWGGRLRGICFPPQLLHPSPHLARVGSPGFPSAFWVSMAGFGGQKETGDRLYLWLKSTQHAALGCWLLLLVPSSFSSSSLRDFASLELGQTWRSCNYGGTGVVSKGVSFRVIILIKHLQMWSLKQWGRKSGKNPKTMQYFLGRIKLLLDIVVMNRALWQWAVMSPVLATEVVKGESDLSWNWRLCLDDRRPQRTSMALESYENHV